MNETATEIVKKVFERLRLPWQELQTEYPDHCPSVFGISNMIRVAGVCGLDDIQLGKYGENCGCSMQPSVVSSIPPWFMEKTLELAFARALNYAVRKYVLHELNVPATTEGVVKPPAFRSRGV